MGPEFGGSIGEGGAFKTGDHFLVLSSSICLSGFLFYLANIAGSALNVVACTEGVLSNFGATQGALVHILPEDHWWQVQTQTQTQTKTHIGDK